MTSKDPPIKYYVIAGFFTIFLGFGFTILPDIAESTNREYLFGEKFGMFLMTLGAVFTGIDEHYVKKFKSLNYIIFDHWW